MSILVAFLQLQKLFRWEWNSWAATYLPSVDSFTISWPCDKIANISLTFDLVGFLFFYMFQSPFLVCTFCLSALYWIIWFPSLSWTMKMGVTEAKWVLLVTTPKHLKECLRNTPRGGYNEAHADILCSLFSFVFYFLNTIVSLHQFTKKLLFVMRTTVCKTVSVKMPTSWNKDFLTLTWNFWRTIARVRQPWKITGHRFLGQRSFLMKSCFFVPAGNKFGRKWTFHRFLFLENIFDREV